MAKIEYQPRVEAETSKSTKLITKPFSPKIEKVTGSKTFSSMASNNKYPADLPLGMSVVLKVYNSNDGSLNSLLGGIGNMGDKLKKAFGDGGGGASDAAGAASKSSISKAFDALGAIGGGSFDIVKDLTGQTIDGFKNAWGAGSFGNGKLPQSWITNYYLPLPNELAETLSHDYKEEPGWADTVDTAVAGGAVKGAISKAAGVQSTIAKMTGGRTSKYYENKIAVYDSTAFRTVTLTWTLTPNNAGESKLIHQMITELKMYSSPESAAGKLMVKSPHFFKLHFGNPTFDSAMQFHEVVITEVQVGYSPGGGMEMFKDQTPKTVELSITFKDREPKLADDWANGQ